MQGIRWVVAANATIRGLISKPVTSTPLARRISAYFPGPHAASKMHLPLLKRLSVSDLS